MASSAPPGSATVNIGKNYLHTISGSASIWCCIVTHFRTLVWPHCRWFCLQAQSHSLPQLMDNNSEYLTDNYHIVGDQAFHLIHDILTQYKKSKRRYRTRA